jgi:hypothetical protein
LDELGAREERDEVVVMEDRSLGAADDDDVDEREEDIVCGKKASIGIDKISSRFTACLRPILNNVHQD